MLRGEPARILLVVILALLTASSTIYAFEGETDKFSESLEHLIKLNIIQNYVETDFNPKENMTRAETAVMLRRMMNPDTTTGISGGYFLNAEGILEEFGDNRYAVAEIDVLKKINVISGYDDGSIRPDREITYSECIKMLVCMLGYKDDAIRKGGWSKGYVKCAEEIGLLQNISVKEYSLNAVKGDVVIMINNALSIPRNLVSVCDAGKSLALTPPCGTYSVDGVVQETVEGITFEEILTNPDLDVENEKYTGESYSSFKEDRIIAENTGISVKGSGFSIDGIGNFTLYFENIDKSCDYYISLVSMFNEKYNRMPTEEEYRQNIFAFVEAQHPTISNVGPISTDSFTFTNIPRGSYYVCIMSSPCKAHIAGTIVLDDESE